MISGGPDESATVSLGHAAEQSFLLTRQAASRSASTGEFADRADSTDPLVLDVAAGIALHAGRPGDAAEYVARALARPELSYLTEGLLRIKAFAAAGVVGDAELMALHAAWLLDHAERHGDHAVAAIVWSGMAVIAAATGSTDDVGAAKDAYERLHIPEELTATREGTSDLINLALTILDGPPAALTEQWAESLVGSARSVLDIGRRARAVGRPLVATAPGLLTDRMQSVLSLLALGHTNATIAAQLGVAPRTVQADVTALKRAYAVTNRAGLVAAARAAMGDVATDLPVNTPSLTVRQQAVLGLVAAGFTNAGIAGRLGISERTVERHLEEAALRLGVRGRTASATRWAQLARDQPSTHRAAAERD